MARDLGIERRYAPDQDLQLRALLLVLGCPGLPVRDTRFSGQQPGAPNPDRDGAVA
jgi:hypothetical protein